MLYIFLLKVPRGSYRLDVVKKLATLVELERELAKLCLLGDGYIPTTNSFKFKLLCDTQSSSDKSFVVWVGDLELGSLE